MKNVAALLASIVLAFTAAVAQVTIPVTAVSISGTVFDDPYPMRRASMPIPGTKVGLWRQLAVLNSAGTVLPDSVRIDAAVTDASGKFSFPSATAGTYLITVDDSGYNSRSISVYVTRDTSMMILLVSAGAHAHVAGTVWQACSGVLGMPCILSAVAGCTVTVVKDMSVASPAPVLVQSFTAVTNTQGQYSFDSIPVTVNGERISVSAGKTGFVVASVDTSIRNTTTTTVNFTLQGTVSAPHDTVYVLPLHPTALDSLTFTLVNTEHCCATVYSSKMVTVNDTMMFLSYAYDDSLCSSVRCFVAGSQTDFTGKPVAAGRYSIYKEERFYCPPTVNCPMIAFAPVLVGRITVAPGSGVLPPQRATANHAVTGMYLAGTTAWVTVPNSGRVTLRAYDLRGALVRELFSGWMGAGTHRVALSTTELGSPAASALLLLRLVVDGKESVARTVAVSR
jgi:hypothetical protein